MHLVTNYDEEYRRCESACGEPFGEFVAFFDSLESRLSVLDLGCGQGRDSLMAARRGHSVHGVDLSPTGIAQLAAIAKSEQLSLKCEVADVEKFEPKREYDVVVIDRVLHMLASDQRRISLLEKAVKWVQPGGFVLIADTRRHRELIRIFFEERGWRPVLKKKDNLFVRHPG